MAVMRGATRKWKDNSEFAGKADAEKVQDEINLVASLDPHKKCGNKELVEFARNHPASETYKCFEWDDTVAAESYRLHQASRIKCAIITVTQSVPKTAKNNLVPIPIPVEVITNHSLPTPGDGHKDIQVILKSKGDTDALDLEMYENLRTYVKNFKKRFLYAPHAAQYIQQLETIVSQIP